MISKLSAKYQVCAIRTADTRDGQLTTPGVYTWVVRELSIVCPSFIPAPMRLPCNTFYNFMLFTNYVCIYFHVVAK